MSIQPIALDQEGAANFVAVSISTMEKLVREQDFPKPRKVSARRVVWLVSELTAWVHARPVSDLLPPPNAGYGKAGKPN